MQDRNENLSWIESIGSTLNDNVYYFQIADSVRARIYFSCSELRHRVPMRRALEGTGLVSSFENAKVLPSLFQFT